MALTSFQKKIGFQFTQQALLQQALTHKSYGSPHYERLEFLGDSILNAWVSIWLMHLFPQLSEGQLSTMRAAIVSKKALSEVGLQWQILDYCRQSLPKSHLEHAKTTLLADCVESVVAAVYLDAGWEACGDFLWPWLSSQCHNAHQTKRHSKTALQEWCQKNQITLPIYESQEISSGFLVHCRIEGVDHETKAQAKSKRQAQSTAAASMLEWLEKNI